MAVTIKGFGSDWSVPEGAKTKLGEIYALKGETGDPVILPAGRRRVFLGDSITAGSGATHTVNSWVTRVGMNVGNEILTSVREGHPGENSGQLLARLPGILDANPATQAVHIACGTNDAGQTVTPTAYIANMEAMRDLCAARGLPVSVSNIPPRGVGQDAATQARTVAMNLALSQWATAKGVPLVDVFKPLADPATGRLVTAYDADGVHPTDAGHAVIAEAVGKMVVAQVPRAPFPVSSAGLGLTPNPLNLGTEHFDTVGGTTLAGKTFVDPVANDGLTAGKWYRVPADNTTGSISSIPVLGRMVNMTDVAAGDVLLFAGKFKIEGTAAVSLRVLRGATSTSVPVENVTKTPAAGTLVSYTVQAADIGQNIRWGFSISVPSGSSGVAYFGQWDAFNLTKLGITGSF